MRKNEIWKAIIFSHHAKSFVGTDFDLDWKRDKSCNFIINVKISDQIDAPVADR